MYTFEREAPLRVTHQNVRPRNGRRREQLGFIGLSQVFFFRLRVEGPGIYRVGNLLTGHRGRVVQTLGSPSQPRNVPVLGGLAHPFGGGQKIIRRSDRSFRSPLRVGESLLKCAHLLLTNQDSRRALWTAGKVIVEATGTPKTRPFAPDASPN